MSGFNVINHSANGTKSASTSDDKKITIRGYLGLKDNRGEREEWGK
jgi:hypothetical protein